MVIYFMISIIIFMSFLLFFSINYFKKRSKTKNDSLINNRYIMVVPGNAQYIGTRKQQEDSFGFSDICSIKENDRIGAVAIVADGMGGLSNGKEASSISVNTMLEEYKKKTEEESVGDALYRSVIRTNNKVNEMTKIYDCEGNMGTTLICAVVYKGKLYWVSIGDSRIYLYRDGKLYGLTNEHTFGNELEQKVINGEITWEEANNHPEKDYLTSFIGGSIVQQIDKNETPIALYAEDKILLCSDGVFKTISDNRIASLICNDTQETAENIISAVISMKKRNQDNATIAILGFQSD